MDYQDVRERLKKILLDHSVMHGEFTLASGKHSKVYVDCRLTTLRAEAMPLIGWLIWHEIQARGWRPQAVGGLTMGADPVACAVARESLELGTPLNAFLVRKQDKQHGRMRNVEGLASTQGVSCVVLDDVCTSGMSTVQAIERSREAGMEVLGAVCLVDREQGARDAMQELGCELAAIYTMKELLAG